MYLLGILFYTVLRLLFFIANYSQFAQIHSHKGSLLCYAFFMGWRFDTVVSMYILAFPAVVLFVFYYLRKTRKFSISFFFMFCSVIYPLSYLISFADIPYYSQFGNRLNIMAFTWFDHPTFVFKMIFGEVRYWIFIIPLIGVIWLWIRILLKNKRYGLLAEIESMSHRISKIQISAYWLSAVLVFGLMFVGLRGRMEKKTPILIGTAFFSNYNIINQLGLNPSFTLLRSWLDDIGTDNKQLKLTDDTLAVADLQKSLGIQQTLIGESPIARMQNDSLHADTPNIVLVIMESMSTDKMHRYGNSLNLTPNLEHLASHAIFFNRIYTAGIHTFNGIFSTLYSFPALLKKHSMNEFPIPEYFGLPGVLKQYGYQNTFYLTHDDQFDNVGGFLKSNFFDKIVSQSDYTSEQVIGPLGVPDHVMFEHAVKEITRTQSSGIPFFAAFMTGSDHGPYIIPKDIPFKPKTSDIKTAIVEYADWAIGHFIELAKNEKWFSNTIFVFVADHGYWGRSAYEVSLDYHHTPFIVYAPEFIQKEVNNNKIGLQIDVAPTILGFLHLNYINNTPGINLLATERKYAIFSSDEKIGCINDSLFLIIRDDGTRLMFNYKINSIENIINKHKAIADSMERASYSLIQASQWLKINKLTGKPKGGSFQK